MDYDWDAIIIGGGPAGSTVARYAAEGGAKVLVIDRRKQIGTPLQCGELVPANNELKQLQLRIFTSGDVNLFKKNLQMMGIDDEVNFLTV